MTNKTEIATNMNWLVEPATEIEESFTYLAYTTNAARANLDSVWGGFEVMFQGRILAVVIILTYGLIEYLIKRLMRKRGCL